MYVSKYLFIFLNLYSTCLESTAIASIVVQEALLFSYDGKIVHIVPIMYMLTYFYNIDNMLF